MKNTKKLYLMNLMTGMLFYTPIVTLFLLDRGFSLGFIVVAQTVFSVAMMAAEMPTGVLADKYGQKFSLKISLLLDAFGMLQLLLIHNPTALIAFFAVRGVSIAFRSGSDEALFYESYVEENKSPKGYSKAYARFLSNDILGFILATAFAGIAVQIFGAGAYVPLIILTGLTTLAAFVIVGKVKMDRKSHNDKDEFKSLNHLKSSFKLVKKNRVIYALLIAGLLTLSGEYFLRQTYQPFFEEMSVPALFLGVALAAGKVLNYFVIRWSHVMEEHLTVDQIIFWVNALMGALFLIFAFSGSAWIIVPAFILIQGLFNAERPVVSDYVNQNVESHQRSTVLSAVSFAQNLGQIATRLVLGASIGLFSVSFAFGVQGAYVLIGAFIGAWYLRRCGCVHKVQPTEDYSEDLELAEELA